MTKKMQERMRINALLLPILILFACAEDKKERVLPMVGNHTVEYKKGDGESVDDTIFYTIPAFDGYIDQDSTKRSSKDVEGKIKIVDFFFTHCPTICPPMTTQMKRLSILTKDLQEQVQFVSFSIDPKRDTMARLQEYIKLHGIEARNWFFLTGVKAEKTHQMAKAYFNFAEKNKDVPGGFGHTSYFALVDKENHVRGLYNGTSNEEVDQLEKDLRKLLKHEYNY